MDERTAAGRRIVVLAHCLLNQNTKPHLRARFPGVVPPILDVLAREGIALFQLPCPEIAFAGPWRFSQVIEQYDTPAYRSHCRGLVEQTVDQLAHCLAPVDDGQDYRVALVGVEGSPSCGITQVGRSTAWRGFPGSVAFDGRYPVGPGMGVFMQEFHGELERRHLRTPACFGVGLDMQGLNLDTLATEFQARLRQIFPPTA